MQMYLEDKTQAFLIGVANLSTLQYAIIYKYVGLYSSLSWATCSLWPQVGHNTLACFVLLF